jgi:hypothetical protein
MNNDIVVMDMKAAQPPIPEFCGLLYYQGELFYNYPVLGAKILSRYYKDQEDLEQYQISVADKLKPYFENPEPILGALGVLMNTEVENARIFMDQLRNFTKFSWSDLQNELVEINYLDTVY